MNNCPCCSNQLLRHIRGHELYFFCRRCWQEMPVMRQTYRRQITSSFIEQQEVSHAKLV